jgi:pimeloyl-ACP methyl ester carboxylesterase
VSLYWFTRTAASSVRLYRESIGEVSTWFDSTSGDRPTFTVDVPTGALVFPAEVPRPSRRWAEERFPRIVQWVEPDRGGHFGAWEQPETVARELRALARALG